MTFQFFLFFCFRFKKDVHQIWLEPEGLTSDVIYPNGLSCTLPEELQFKLVRTLPGLENVTMLSPGYRSLFSNYDLFSVILQLS